MRYNNYISCHKDKKKIIWTIDMMPMEELMLLCVWGHKYKSKHYLSLIYIFLPSALWDKKAIAEVNSPTHHEGWIVSDQEIIFCSF
jgi:hypothetical protein